MLDLLLSLRN